jgi:hypothetical protein
MLALSRVSLRQLCRGISGPPAAVQRDDRNYSRFWYVIRIIIIIERGTVS